MILHETGLNEAEAALREWHIALLGYDPTDPGLVRRTAHIAIEAYLTTVGRMDAEAWGYGSVPMLSDAPPEVEVGVPDVLTAGRPNMLRVIWSYCHDRWGGA